MEGYNNNKSSQWADGSAMEAGTLPSHSLDTRRSFEEAPSPRRDLKTGCVIGAGIFNRQLLTSHSVFYYYWSKFDIKCKDENTGTGSLTEDTHVERPQRSFHTIVVRSRSQCTVDPGQTSPTDPIVALWPQLACTAIQEKATGSLNKVNPAMIG